ncbi:MAG: NUDIX hydrolase [Balneolales bacterium]
MPRNPEGPVSVTAAGGLVFKIENGQTQVLLIHRKGLWDLPKGKLDDDESIPRCAVREVAEETGCEQPLIVKELTPTVHYYSEEGQKIEKTTHWFVMIIRGRAFSPQLEEDIIEVRWIALNEAIRKVGYENLRTVLRQFRDELMTSPKNSLVG